jgi:hypothetical protein
MRLRAPESLYSTTPPITSQWSDDMTFDYNFQANFWSSSTANRPELVLIYAATVLDSRLVDLAKSRASNPVWSLGGWPDQLGAEVMGMSCGPTPDWDHDLGCPEGFGGFKGVEFVACSGPFRGMECCFDDGERFVAGLVATPLIQVSGRNSREEGRGKTAEGLLLVGLDGLLMP